MTNSKEFVAKLRKLERSIQSTTLKNMIARKARELIYKRTKKGTGVNSVDQDPKVTDEKKLTPLSSKYVEYRKKINKRPFKSYQFQAGKFFSPRRSNLTLTGQMLDSIKFTVDANGIRIFIPDDNREDGKHTNAEVAGFVQDNGRNFFALTQSDLKILVAIYNDFLTRKIREIFGT